MSANEKCNKKTNLLVYQSPTGTRSDRKPACDAATRVYKPPICAPKPKQIRVCTGAELKKMCTPKLCPCPRERKGSMLLSLLGFILRTAVAAGAVYVSYDLGVWGTTEDTHQMYRAYCNILSEPNPKKARKWEPPSCDAEKDMFKMPSFNPKGHCDKPPFDMERQGLTIKNYWNHAIECIFGGLAGFPTNLTGLKKDKEDPCVKMEPNEEGIIESNYK